MKIDFRSLMRDHLYNVEYISIYCDLAHDPVTYEYEDIFTKDIFKDYFIDDSLVRWSVNVDGLGSLFLKISPKI